jgi:hypothetical protein
MADVRPASGKHVHCNTKCPSDTFDVIVRQAFGSGEDVREPIWKFLLLCVELKTKKEKIS